MHVFIKTIYIAHFYLTKCYTSGYLTDSNNRVLKYTENVLSMAGSGKVGLQNKKTLEKDHPKYGVNRGINTMQPVKKTTREVWGVRYYTEGKALQHAQHDLHLH